MTVTGKGKKRHKDGKKDTQSNSAWESEDDDGGSHR